MKKLCSILCIGILLSACGAKSLEDQGFDADQIRQLEELKLTSQAESCENTAALKAGISDQLDEGKLETICSISKEIQNYEGISTLAAEGLTASEIEEFLNIPFYHGEHAQRYVNYRSQASSIEETVMLVNMNHDKPFFTDVETIADTKDMTMLINKYYKLPEGYVPENLVEAPHSCTVGEQYSCQTDQPIMLVKEVADHLEELAQALKQRGSDLYVIAGYRSYQYQTNLYNYNLNASGQEYADAYYARPGQSEHNSGISVDITLDDVNFNELKTSPQYTWLLDHIADYGFILRYPEDKVDMTGYGYESWHLRYVGKELAQELKESGLTLDEYYGRK